MRVLVADKSPGLDKTVGQLIIDGGGNAVTVFAGSNKEALKILRDQPIAMAIVDGAILAAEKFQLLKNIRADAAVRRIPMVVIFSGIDPVKVPSIAEKIGIKYYLVKPFDNEALKRRMNQAVGGIHRLVRPGTKPPKPVPAKQHSPEEAEAFYKSGMDKLELRKYDAAISHLARAVKAKPEYPEAYEALSRALKGQGDMERSRQFLSKAAEAYVHIGKHDKAEEVYGDLKKADGKAPNPFKKAGEKLMEEGNYVRAAKHYERAAKLSPRDDDISCSLAEAYQLSGDNDKAVRTIRGVLEKKGRSERAEQIYLELTGENWYGQVDEPPEKLQVLEEQGARGGPEMRRAVRVPLADYFVDVSRAPKPLPVVDLSRTGIGFKDQDVEFTSGEEITFNLMALNKVKIKKIHVRVMHISKGLVGCRFKDLSSKQEKQLGEIISKEEPEDFSIDTDNVNFDLEMW